MSETHDLTQRAEAITQRMVNLEGSEHHTSLHDLLDVQDMLRDLLAALVQAEQEKADILQKDRIKTHEINLLTQENRVQSARLATQEAAIADNHHNALTCPYCNPKGLVLVEEATIRQVEQEMRKLRNRLFEESNDISQLAPRFDMRGWLEEEGTNLERWADTLQAILPAEDRGEVVRH